MNERYDCIVIGAGPAGSTVATLVAEAGHQVLLLEREKMPRFHIGESLMPETYWTLKRLGLLERMKASHNPKKYSVQFVPPSGRESAPFYFFERDDHESSQTWQVLRSDFDQMLFENAAEKGALCCDQTRVVDVLFEGNRAVGVHVKTPDGAAREIRGKVIVDATGQQSLVAMRLKLREPHPQLRKASIWGYYRGARRDPGIDEGATIILHTDDAKAWFWYIPLADNVVSVGVVADMDYLLKGESTPEEIFDAQVARCGGVAKRIAEGCREGPLRVVRDFSYLTSQAAGDGWVLVGDAYGFLDPIYSSGVFLALKSGEMAADAIIEGLGSGDTSGEQLGKWSEEFSRGLGLIGKLIEAFYTDSFSFGQFIKQFPQHRGRLTDLLVGKVFRPGVEAIFEDMDPWLEHGLKRASASETEASS